MSALRLVANECKLLARSRLAWAIVLLTAAMGAMGVNAQQLSNQTVLRGMNHSAAISALGSAEYAAVGGAVLFAVLTLLALSRDHRARSRDLMDAGRDYAEIVWARIAALLVSACSATVAVALAGWAAHSVIAGGVYDLELSLFSYLTITLPALLLSVMLCAGIYLTTENQDVSFLGFGALFLVGMTASNYLLRWVQGSASTYSDFGGIEPVARYVLYNRLLWTCIAAAAILLGRLMLRRRGCNAVQSLVLNVGRGATPFLLAVFVTTSVVLWRNEPYLYSSNSFSQDELPVNVGVRLQQIKSHLTLYPSDHRLAVKAGYIFEKNERPTQLTFATNTGLRIESATVNGTASDWERIEGTDQIRLTLPSSTRAEVTFSYRGTITAPSRDLVTGYIDEKSVYLLENSYWLFSPLVEFTDRVDVSGSVTAPRELTVVTPGKLKSVADDGQSRRWDYWATTSRVNVGIFAADYVVECVQVGELEVELYMSRRHADAIREVKISKFVTEILAYYQQMLGPYPFDEWPIKIVEAPLYKWGGHSSLNVVTVAEYLLNRETPNDPTRDILFLIHDINLLAHELAHQWWSTGVELPESGSWTSEGLAEYTAYRYFADNYDEGVAKTLERGWQTTVDGARNSFYAQHPEALLRVPPELAKKMAQSTMIIDAYNLVPLKLLRAEQHFGKKEFTECLSEVYMKHRGGSLEYEQFLSETGITQEVWTID